MSTSNLLKQAARYFEQNKYKQAINLYDRAIKGFPQNPESYYGKGEVLEQLKRYKDALECYDHALKLNSSNAEYYSSKGEVLIQLSKYDEAIKSFAKAIKINPSEWWFHFGKGDACYFKKHYSKAITAYKRASRLNLASSAVYFRLAICHTKIGNKRAACNALVQAVQLDDSLRKKLSSDKRFRALRLVPKFKALVSSH